MSASLALGPFHPAWRGPQRFFLTFDGERITDVEFTNEYNARGCAARIPRLPLSEALQLVARVCGACSIAHTQAFCSAIEQVCGIVVPPRAAALRCCAAELERIGVHLDAAARVLWSLGMEPRAAILGELAGSAREGMARLAGAPIVSDLLLPGGVAYDLGLREREDLLLALARHQRTLYRQIDELIDHQALLARTVDIGTLPRAAAEQFGAHGPLARASGLPRDTRVDRPYGFYDGLAIRTITQDGGDVYARLMVLLLEAYESGKLAEQLLRDLPGGPWEGRLPEELPRGQTSASVEAPRGPLRYTIETDGARITRVQIDPPRQLDRLLVRTLLTGALIDNAVAIIASADHCAACAEC